ncbi:MAG: SH3 domain-containing protein [Anaerolineae bacterium]|jgi:uncharacterized protein YraI|nr:SH3 domain-containing protein [Anaerolineae bacterium]
MSFRSLRLPCLLLLLCLSVVGAGAQGVRAVVVNDNANIRLTPALGAEVIGTVAAGFTFEIITARSADNEWLRVDYFGDEGWVNLAPLSILNGDVNALPVGDPRTIPYGGFGSPRAGPTRQTGPVSAAATDGVRLRAGPGRGYPTLANINFNQAVTLTGRTASNRWYQVAFEGTLGWASATFFVIRSGDVNALPVDGIVADGPPPSGEGLEDYIATLRLLRDRINIAQEESLNVIRAYWTDAALNGRAACSAYPPRPSDINIAIPLLAANYDTLNPLQTDFNVAMANLRLAIDLFIEICNLPGTGNPVGVATTQGALDVVNLTETQFNSLRDRLARLIPNDAAGPGQCLLAYNRKTEVLPVISLGVIYLDEFTRRNYATGYCFDGVANQIINFQALPFPNSNLASMFVAISPLDNPRSFIGVTQAGGGQLLSLGPITLPRTTRYVIIFADPTFPAVIDPRGRFAVRAADVGTGLVALNLRFDEATQSIILSTELSSAITSQAIIAPTPGPGATTAAPPSVCPSTAFNCNQLFTCAEAQACLAAGNFNLDADADGIPCEETLCR